MELARRSMTIGSSYHAHPAPQDVVHEQPGNRAARRVLPCEAHPGSFAIAAL